MSKKTKKKRTKKYNPLKNSQALDSQKNTEPQWKKIHEHIDVIELCNFDDFKFEPICDSPNSKNMNWYEVHITHPHGTISTQVTKSVLHEIEKAPARFIEQHVGLSYPHYIEWISNDGKPHCTHIKDNGERCRNRVSGPTQMTPKQFMALQGKTCSSHGGIFSKDVDIYFHEQGVRNDRENFKPFYTELDA